MFPGNGLLIAAIIVITGLLIFFLALGIAVGRMMCWVLHTHWSFKTAFFDAMLAVLIPSIVPMELPTRVLLLFNNIWMIILTVLGVALKHFLYFAIRTKKYLYIVRLITFLRNY